MRLHAAGAYTSCYSTVGFNGFPPLATVLARQDTLALMARLDGTTRRAIGGHAAGALALSVPWPLLLVEVARRSDDPFLLGLAGSARMVPFIVCSWAAGRLADRMRRDLLIRLTLVARGALLLLTAVALVTGHVWAAVVAAGVAVAVATPAYPALVAAMPGLAQRREPTGDGPAGHRRGGGLRRGRGGRRRAAAPCAPAC